MWLLVKAVVELVCSWWRADRIRASPREGKLLRVTPGSIVCIRGMPLEISQRVVHETSRGPVIRYTCSGTDGPSDLWLVVAPELTIQWTGNGRDQQISPEEIEVWTPKNNKRRLSRSENLPRGLV